MATSTSTVVETRQQLSKKTTVPVSSGDEHDQINELARPTLQRSTTIHNPSPGFSHRHRHSKKLSLNFPIAVPVAYDPSMPMTANGSTTSFSQSPSIASPYQNAVTPTSGMYAHMPFPSPDKIMDYADGDGLLTLIAGQERRVMELKEELLKAETGLLNLKKQWAVFESKKKNAELKSKPMRTGQANSKNVANGSAEEEELERMKKREAREKERKMRELALMESATAGGDKPNANGGKGKGGRVLAGRHTRTLSLLQNTGGNNNENPEGEAQQKTRSESATTPLDEAKNNPKRQPRKSISRQQTLQELIATSATGAAQLNFGKTYKDLAHAGRKSLPPGTDDLVKQGKQVYDGINQGFWSFVEDIRQATVGDEAINGPAPTEQRREVRQKRSNKKLASDHSGDKQGKKKSKPSDEHKNDKDNFWKEFGIETPKGAKNRVSTKRNKENQAPLIDHESKSSTDSKCPPSLLADLTDVNEDDESWDNWPADSPQAQRRAEQRVNIRRDSEENDSDDSEAISAEARKAFNRKLQAKKPVETNWTDLMS